MKKISNLFKLQPSYKKMLTIEDLKAKNTKIRNISMKDKKNIKILIIDDAGFDTERLKRLGYIDIKKVDRFTNMDELEIYDIILCDFLSFYK